MSRLMESKQASIKAIRRALREGNPSKLQCMTDALVMIHDVLWPKANPADVEWDAARCEKIAAILNMLENEITD